MAWTTLLLLALSSLAAAGDALARDPAPRVFILQSYNPEYVWTQNINQGIRDALAGLLVDYEYFYLDAKRQPDPKRLQSAGEEALRRIRQWAPQVVVSVDDAAQALVVAPHLKGLASPQVVFCGVNAPLSLYGFPATNVSGVRERWHYREGFALLKRIAPSLRRVTFLVEESESGRFVLEDLREEERRGGPFALELAEASTVKTFQEWQRLILRRQSPADALALGLYNTLKDEATGRVVSPDDVMAWTNSANTRTTLGFSDIAKDHGLLCGVLESGHEQGFLAGSLARTVLTQGVAAGSLPVEINVRGVVLVNLKTAARLGIKVPYEIIEAAGVVLQ
jgi:ABC-type uncharacterized transport system substrate-binding protein